MRRSSKEAIQYIISTANRLSGAERGGIFLTISTEDNCTFRLRASKNLTQDQIGLPEFNASFKMMSDAVKSREGKVQGLRIQENIDAPDEKIILSSMCAPIVFQDRVLGILYHDNRLLSNAFNESLLDMLSILTSYIASILKNEGILNENERLKAKIEELKHHYEPQNTVCKPGNFNDIIGESSQIRRVLDQISEIAATDTTVLILGETGVGKELVAKAILNNSLRKNKPFISLNCSALSEELIYSELFGHEKGSFTGAGNLHIGRFEKAHEGTLFLDEIGELPLDVQVRLLRVLETKKFERVGGRETICSDFRLITATNRDLEQAVKKDLFRDDLFYRINVFPIYVPPLRERREDIPLLINFFLKVQLNRTGRITRMITEEEMLDLMQYKWPGNVRELKNCIERYIVSPHTRITDLLNQGYRHSAIQENTVVTLQENERRHIEWALAETNGKIHGPGGAAELLNIHPNTLTFRIKKLGIKSRRSGKNPGANSNK
jgi:transcriptional regulator with GAF, ATPase, and Fis domain